jgi:formylglycine-generating enzyme required for sulfatase activity
MSPAEARERQQQLDVEAPRIELGDAGSIELVAIPAGSFVMGDAKGYPDERPHAARIDRPIWMATREITNAQYAQFDTTHYSGYFDNLGKNNGRKGRPLNEPAQPVIRVSWHEARAFCQYLSQRTGLPVRLPTEAEWEYACRAGAETSMHYGPCDADFSKHENLADRSLLEQNYFFYLAPFERRNVGMRYNVAPFSVNNRFDDGLTSPDGTGKLAPNAFGLYDMHGNVQEWTSSTYLPYPYRADKAREGAGGPARRVARGGSWADRPRDARAGIRRPYPPWQRVHNVGLRIVVDMPPDGASAGK